MVMTGSYETTPKRIQLINLQYLIIFLPKSGMSVTFITLHYNVTEKAVEIRTGK